MPLTLNTAGKINKGKLAALCADALTELDRACCKFPAFPEALIGAQDTWTPPAEELEGFRLLNDAEGGAQASAFSVFMEEFFEFVEAAQAGRAEDARRELVQSMAMLLRAYVHLDEYCHKKDTSHA